MENNDAASGAAVGATLPFPSFLNLPDEVLRLVFEFDYALGQPKPPFHYTLNKRISVICLPLLHRHLSISKQTKDAVLDSIYEDQKRRVSLKALDLHFDNEIPRLTCRILRGLPHLTSLSIILMDAHSFPTYLTDVLRTLVTLRHLQLTARPLTPVEDTTFRFSELPALQSLDLAYGCALNALVDGTDRPIDLKLDSNFNGLVHGETEYPSLPWSSIRSLTLPVFDTLSVLGLGPKSMFWQSFVGTLGKVDPTKPSSYNHLPLKTLSLTAYRGCNPDFEQNWLDLLDLLSETQLDSLAIADLLPTSLSPAQRPLRTVKKLTVHTDERLIKHGSNWSNLVYFLELFPNLKHLHSTGTWFDRYSIAEDDDDLQTDEIRYTDFHQLPTTVDDLAQLRLIDSRARYPHLYALFEHLRETSVLEVRLGRLKREMRWRRSRSGEAFQADCWAIE